MSIFIARWDDGSGQIGTAHNRDEFMDLLDEIGSPRDALVATGTTASRYSIDVGVPTFDSDLGLSFSLKRANCDSGYSLLETLSSGFPNLSKLADAHAEAQTTPSDAEWKVALDADLDSSPDGWKIGELPKWLGKG
jgi:hypothetical protein